MKESKTSKKCILLKFSSKEEMLRNKTRAQESQIKELLQWNSKSPTNPTPIVYTQAYTPNTMGPIHLNVPHQNFLQPNSSTSSTQ